jgi:hypothetical protein
MELCGIFGCATVILFSCSIFHCFPGSAVSVLPSFFLFLCFGVLGSYLGIRYARKNFGKGTINHKISDDPAINMS